VIVCLAANPSIDRLFEVESLTAGAVHRPRTFTQVAGGKGLNVARAVTTLGAEVQVVTILAGHAGRWLEEQLEHAGIPVQAVWVDGESRSSLSVADRRRADLTEFYEHGVPVGAEDWHRFTAAASVLSYAAAWMTVSGSVPHGAPDDGYLQLESACALGMDTIAPRPPGAELVKLNAAEAAHVTGIDAESTEGAIAAARALAGSGTGVVTRGAAGAVLVAPDGVAVHGTLDAPGRYPVGSGDSFLAGLVVARAAGAGWDDALALALGAGSANAAVPGAACFARSDAERLAQRAAVTRA
jgi:1-phosphofructokinase/tagatose 6-phosphate kinase